MGLLKTIKKWDLLVNKKDLRKMINNKHKITSFIYKNMSKPINDILVFEEDKEKLRKELFSVITRKKIENILESKLNESKNNNINIEDETEILNIISLIIQDIYYSFRNNFTYQLFWKEEIDNIFFELFYGVNLKNIQDKKIKLKSVIGI